MDLFTFKKMILCTGKHLFFDIKSRGGGGEVLSLLLQLAQASSTNAFASPKWCECWVEIDFSISFPTFDTCGGNILGKSAAWLLLVESKEPQRVSDAACTDCFWQFESNTLQSTVPLESTTKIPSKDSLLNKILKQNNIVNQFIR